VYWSNLPCRIEPSSRSRGCAAVNAALAAAHARHGQLKLVDWADAANPHREYLGADGTFDAIHLTAPGARDYARLVAAALDAHFRPR
jgi:hypothetical protein